MFDSNLLVQCIAEPLHQPTRGVGARESTRGPVPLSTHIGNGQTNAR